MRKHQRSEEIARVGFLAVWYLTRNHDIHRIVGRLGGIRLLLEMLGEHGVGNVEVAENGIYALKQLTVNNVHRFCRKQERRGGNIHTMQRDPKRTNYCDVCGMYILMCVYYTADIWEFTHTRSQKTHIL